MPTRSTEAGRTGAAPVRLFYAAECPYARRVRFVLEHLDIPYEVEDVDLRHPPDALLEANPYGLVPTIEHENTHMYESNIINQYLDERFDGGLMPDRAAERAWVRMLMAHADARWMPLFDRLAEARRRGTDAQIERALAAVAKGLEDLEQRFERRGPFLMGPALTLADVAFATTVPVLEPELGCRPPQGETHVNGWIHAVRRLPAWHASGHWPTRMEREAAK